jgi:PleD family two-component response regulator
MRALSWVTWRIDENDQCDEGNHDDEGDRMIASTIEIEGPDGASVLIVDDCEIDRLLYRTILARAGMAVSEAASMVDAFTRCAATRFAAVLIDKNLRNGSGIELCRRLREIEQYRAVPLIVMSGEEESRFSADAFAAGATHLIRKSADFTGLLRLLRHAMLGR